MAKGEELAMAFEKINGEVIVACQSCSDADWGKVSSAEGWSVGVLAHHLAGAHPVIAGLAQAVGNGQSPDLPSMDQLHAMNAQHAQENAQAGKADTIALLQSNGAAAAGILRGLSDAQLATTASVPLMGEDPVSSQAVIEGILLGHPQGHLESMRATVG